MHIICYLDTMNLDLLYMKNNATMMEINWLRNLLQKILSGGSLLLLKTCCNDNGIHLPDCNNFRLQWIAQLNFDKGNEISWDNVGISCSRTEKLATMVRKGIPHSLRHQLWMRLAGILIFVLNICKILQKLRVFKILYHRYINKERASKNDIPRYNESSKLWRIYFLWSNWKRCMQDTTWKCLL